ncbi:MAG: hypothetical protein JKY98_03565 [Gammaproteobacteria bacterium]|nr:hypothetical protein [Gammaproteobacteria bacterium]
MGLLGFCWGLSGVLAMLILAIYRLAPMAFELNGLTLSLLQWVTLVFSVIYMAYAEGYKGFHKGFAPRVVVRANYLLEHPRLGTTILAPLFCMGFIYATRKRKIVSASLTLMIITLVVFVRMLAQPWRGIVDAGVVVGLFLGVCSIIFYLIQLLLKPELLTFSPEVPGMPSTSSEP